jgi:hypothetical protein
MENSLLKLGLTCVVLQMAVLHIARLQKLLEPALARSSLKLSTELEVGETRNLVIAGVGNIKLLPEKSVIYLFWPEGIPKPVIRSSFVGQALKSPLGFVERFYSAIILEIGERPSGFY